MNPFPQFHGAVGARLQTWAVVLKCCVILVESPAFSGPQIPHVLPIPHHQAPTHLNAKDQKECCGWNAREARGIQIGVIEFPVQQLGCDPAGDVLSYSLTLASVRAGTCVHACLDT